MQLFENGGRRTGDRVVTLSGSVELPPRSTTRTTTSSAPAYRKAIAKLERYARFDVPVLLVGESGTGKTMLAEHLHRKSPRAAAPFHRVPICGLADSLVASELFGHLRGSFSDARERRFGHFVSANHGTLFLDEIGKASEAIQAKLLDAVDRNEVTPVGADRAVTVDVRLVAATNVSLPALVEQGRFLPDLWARVGNFVVTIPPLRERRADIPALVTSLVAQLAPGCGYEAACPAVHQNLMDSLCAAEWPNNVRQLQGAVHNLLIAAEGAPMLTLAHWVDTDLPLPRRRHGDRLERGTIESALATASGNPDSAAHMLGVSRAKLYRDAKAAGMGTVGSKRAQPRASQAVE